MARFDLPAVINFILQKTGEEKIYYVGYSQGTTMGRFKGKQVRTLEKYVSKWCTTLPEINCASFLSSLLHVLIIPLWWMQGLLPFFKRKEFHVVFKQNIPSLNIYNVYYIMYIYLCIYNIPSFTLYYYCLSTMVPLGLRVLVVVWATLGSCWNRLLTLSWRVSYLGSILNYTYSKIFALRNLKGERNNQWSIKFNVCITRIGNSQRSNHRPPSSHLH